MIVLFWFKRNFEFHFYHDYLFLLNIQIQMIYNKYYSYYRAMDIKYQFKILFLIILRINTKK